MDGMIIPRHGLPKQQEEHAMIEKHPVKTSATMEDYFAEDAWATDGGNLAAGDPVPPAPRTPRRGETDPESRRCLEDVIFRGTSLPGPLHDR
jgi:hypothetical protein